MRLSPREVSIVNQIAVHGQTPHQKPPNSQAGNGDVILAASYATTTVAASSELATAVDQALYAEDSGLCLDALRGGDPVAVDDISATMTWPGFREAADRMGLKASLSIPLFAGSGTIIAVLNLYSHDLPARLPLNAWVWTVYNTDPDAHPKPDAPLTDASGEDLVIGLIDAFHVAALIQRAIGLVMMEQNCPAEQAYLTLRFVGDALGVDGSAGRVDGRDVVMQFADVHADPQFRHLPPPLSRLSTNQVGGDRQRSDGWHLC